jgi:LysR family transcriptional activator of nhaA
LLARLAIHERDRMVSDSPIGPDVRVRAFNHLLGECGIAIFGSEKLATAYRRRFPRSLDGAPFLMPAGNTSLRRLLDFWLDLEDILPSVVEEFDDSALLKVFGQANAGLLAAADVIEKEVRRQYGVRVIGRVESMRERFYAISVERKVKHPAVVAMTEAARENLFD